MLCHLECFPLRGGPCGLLVVRGCLPGKLKLWCLQFGLFEAVGFWLCRWLLTLYEVAISEVDKSEKMNQADRKWLGVPYCLSSGILELPMTSLVEELKCAITSLEMTLTQFRTQDPRTLLQL